MRVVMFDGAAVKRQKKLNENQVVVQFYTRPPRIVTPAEWVAGKTYKYYESTIARRDVVRAD
jgi:hypothetical protein